MVTLITLLVIFTVVFDTFVLVLVVVTEYCGFIVVDILLLIRLEHILLGSKLEK